MCNNLDSQYNISYAELAVKFRGNYVNSKEELAEQIYKYSNEINQKIVVFHWTYKFGKILAEVLNY